MDETNLSIILNEVSDFVQYAKCLTAEEIKSIRNPVQLTDMQREWKLLHDQYGHLPFTMMDMLVQIICYLKHFKQS